MWWGLIFVALVPLAFIWFVMAVTRDVKKVVYSLFPKEDPNYRPPPRPKTSGPSLRTPSNPQRPFVECLEITGEVKVVERPGVEIHPGEEREPWISKQRTESSD